MKPKHIEPMWPSLISVAVVISSAILAWFGFIGFAVLVIVCFSLLIGTCRIIMQQKAPWKIRSVAFDAFISYALAGGLAITYISILLL